MWIVKVSKGKKQNSRKYSWAVAGWDTNSYLEPQTQMSVATKPILIVCGVHRRRGPVNVLSPLTLLTQLNRMSRLAQLTRLNPADPVDVDAIDLA